MKHPPQIVIKFLRWFCNEDRIEEIEGDLFELFEKRSKDSPLKAKWRFTWDVLKSIRLLNVKKPSFFLNQSIIKNYVKVGFRSMIKDFNYSMINILGLSIGLAAFILMVMMVQSELTFDRFHSKSDRIYEVIQVFENAQGADPEIFTSLQLSKTLKEELAMVENAVTVHSAADTWMTVNGNRFFEHDGIVSGKDFFEIFDFPLKYGDKDVVLKSGRSIILEEQLAKKLFGRDNPIGEVIEIERYGLFTVTGVLETIPSNSFIQFNFIITQDYDVFFTKVAAWFPRWFQSWEGDPAATFVLLRDSEQAESFQDQVVPILKKYIGTETVNPHYLMNLTDLHFGLNGIDGRVNEYVRGDMNQLKLLAAVAFLILAMACFNYINISTARSINRTKEVGVRKSVGALKRQISLQMLTESFLQVFFAFLLSMVLIYFLLPYFNLITGIHLTFSLQVIFLLTPFIVGTIVFVSLLAGFYPAIFLSRFAPATVLKNTAVSAKGNTALRNILVMVQYCLVVIMLGSLFIVNQQYQHLSTKNLGFNSEHLVVVEMNGGGVRRNYQNIKTELLSNSRISGVTALSRMISGYRSPTSVYGIDPENPDKKNVLHYYGMDEDGIKTLGLELLSETGQSLDSTSVILNETAASFYGGEAIIGEWITLADEEDDGSRYPMKVIGIVKDFHYRSLHESVGPVVIGYYLNPFEGVDDIVIRIAENEYTETLSYIESVHNKFDENDIMTWEFTDDMVQRAYEKEMTFRNVFFGSSFVSLIIALLGIIGLISYNASAKSKELGIRKVLGATYIQLVALQGKTFIKFVFAAVIFVTPVTWWLAYNWLQDYAFRIEITPAPFLKALGIVLFCTLITLWIVNHKSARKNPVDALRYQ